MLASLNNDEEGRRIFIGGTSPNLRNLDRSKLAGQVVIGVNRFYKHAPCKYWLCADTAPAAWEAFGKDLLRMDSIRFLHAPTWVKGIPRACADHWVDVTREHSAVDFEFPTPLLTGRTSAIAAAHLAIILGASEIILWGVDITGQDRGVDRDKEYHGPNPVADYWDQRAGLINAQFEFLAQHVPIFKTNRDSPLNLPLWEG